MAVCAEWRSRVLAADQLMDHNLAISDHLPAPHCSAFLHCAKLASRTTGKDIALCATVLSFWEHFILLFWSASYILLTLEHAHCSLALNLALLRLFNCRLHCSCLPAALALVLNCSSSLSIWSGNTLPFQLLPEMFCYQTSWSQLMVEPLILAASSWSHFPPS